MKFNHLRKDDLMTKLDASKMSDWLLKTLSQELAVELKPFKRQVVQTESVIIWTHGRVCGSGPFDLHLEVTILLSLGGNRPPYINSYLALFSGNERIGLLGHEAHTFVMLSYNDKKGWFSSSWEHDDLEYCGKYTEPRTNEYDSFEDKWYNIEDW